MWSRGPRSRPHRLKPTPGPGTALDRRRTLAARGYFIHKANYARKAISAAGAAFGEFRGCSTSISCLGRHNSAEGFTKTASLVSLGLNVSVGFWNPHSVKGCMTSDLRVLFVTNHKHLPELRGGMEVNTHELSLALLQRGAAVGVLCGLAGVGLTGLWARLRRKALRNPCPVDYSLGYPTWRSYDPIPHVASVVHAFRPDAVVVQGGAGFVPLVTECLKMEAPVICYLHTQDRLLLDDIEGAHRLVFIANSSFTSLFHPEKLFAGIIRPIIRPEAYRTTTDRSSAIFINPGPHKGVGIVLSLAEARPDVRFTFVVNRLAERRRDAPWHALPNVHVAGPVTDMRNVYRHGKLLLAPSQWVETWGRVATEVHFSGIPVLASNRGGLPESVGPGGICLPPDAPVACWIRAFSEIWDDPDRYRQMSQAALEYSRRAEISPDVIVDSFMGILISRFTDAKPPAVSGE